MKILKIKKPAAILFIGLLLLSFPGLSCQKKTTKSVKKNKLKSKPLSKTLTKELASDLEFLVASYDTQLFKKNIDSTLETYTLLPKSENGIFSFALSNDNQFLNFVTASENVYSFDFIKKKLKKVEVNTGKKFVPLGFNDKGDKLLIVEIPPEKEGSERFNGTYYAYSFEKNKSEPLIKNKLMFLGAWFSEQLYLNDVEGGGSEKSDVYFFDLKNKKKSLFIKNAKLIAESPDKKKFLLSRLASDWYEKNGDASHCELWAVNENGSNLEKIAFTGMPPNACFSPDGLKIAFLRVYDFKKPAQLVIYDCQTKSQQSVKSLENYNLVKLQWIDSDRLIFSTNPYAGKSFVGLYSLKKDIWIKLFDNANANQILKVFIK